MYTCIICLEKCKNSVFTPDGKLRQLCERCEYYFTNKYFNGGGDFCAQLRNLSIEMRALRYPDTYSAKTIKCGYTSIDNWNKQGLIFPHGRHYCHELEIINICEIKTHMQKLMPGDYDLFFLADLLQGTRNTIYAGDKVMRKSRN